MNYMLVALNEAKKAYKKGEIPIGAVIVNNKGIIAKAYNTRQKSHNVLGHAEINAILKAEKKIGDWRLDDCTLYVTLKPCEMCEKVISESRIAKVYYLTETNYYKNGNMKLEYMQTNDCNSIKNEYECMLQEFFKTLRK